MFFPFLALLFLLGWFMSIIGDKKGSFHSVVTKGAKNDYRENYIQFLPIISEAELQKTRS